MLLPAEVQADILRLFFTEHLSRRAIARQLGVDRKSVAGVIRRRAVCTRPSPPPPRPSILQPHHGLIDRLLEEAPQRSAVNLLQRLRPHGYRGGLSILRDHLRKLRPQKPKPAFLRLDFAPGEAAQLDWGDFGDVFDLGGKVYAFVMVLCWSRLLYLEFTLRQNLPALLRCFERALAFFGGRCREYWLDNMSTAVLERRGRLARLTPGFLAYCGFHGIKPVLCGVGQAHEKGRIENAVKIVRYNFWPGRSFTDLADLNAQASTWRDQFANRREHATTGKVPELAFELERPVLLPLRPEPYDGTDELLAVTSSPFFRVRFDANQYSVPWTLAQRRLLVRADDEQVRIHYGERCIAHHRRCYRKGQDIVNPAHEQGLREHKAAASRSWEVETVRSYGPHSRRYLEILQAGTRSLRSELRELLCLATVYGTEALEAAIGQLLAQGAVGAHHLQRLLRLAHDTPKAPPPMDIADQRLAFVPPTADLRAYDGLLLQQPDQGEPKAAETSDDEELPP